MCFSEYALCKFRMTRPTQPELTNTAEYKALEASEAGPCVAVCRGLICAFNPWLKLDTDRNAFSLWTRIATVSSLVLCAMQIAAVVLLGLDYDKYSESRLLFIFLVFSTLYSIAVIAYDWVCSPTGCYDRTCHMRHADHLMYAAFGFCVVNFVWLIILASIIDNDSSGIQYLKDHNKFGAAVIFILVFSYLLSAVVNAVIGAAALAFGDNRYFDYVQTSAGFARANNKSAPARDPENITHIPVRHG